MGRYTSYRAKMVSRRKNIASADTRQKGINLAYSERCSFAKKTTQLKITKERENYEKLLY